MKTNITIFRHMDAIAHAKNITDGEWAAASKIRRPTIPELRRISRHPLEKTGRSCSVDKVLSLYLGLHKLVGGAELRENVNRCIEQEPDQNVRLVLLSLAMRDSEQDVKDLAERTMRLAIKKPTGKK